MEDKQMQILDISSLIKLQNGQRTVNFFLTFLLPICLVVNSITFGGGTVHIIIILSILAVAFALLFTSVVRTNRINLKFITVFVGAFLGLISTVVNGSGLGSILTFTSLMMLLAYFSTHEMTDTQTRKFLDIIILSTVIFLGVFSKRGVWYDPYYYSIFPALTAEKVNPNTVGIYGFFFAVFSSIRIEKLSIGKNKRFLIQTLIVMVAGAYVYMSDSRTAFFSILVFYVLNVFKVFKKYSNKKKILGVSFALFLLMTLVFVFIYLIMYKHAAWDSSTDFLGKSFFSGRQIVWQEAIDKIVHNPIFGYSNDFEFGGGLFKSAHNSLLAEWFIFGTIPLICCIVCIICAFCSAINKKISTLQISAIFASLILMTFETVISDSDVFLYFVFLFVTQKGEYNNDSKNNSLLLVRG